MFRYIDHKDKTFLLGAYREEKDQLSWILGESPERYLMLYNVRANNDLFSLRKGGIKTTDLPDYILIYSDQNASEGYHLFPCINSAVKEQSEMEALEYPEPNGSYVVYTLGDELRAEPVNMQKLIQETTNNGDVPYGPRMVDGQEIADAVDMNLAQQTPALTIEKHYLRFVDLFAGIGGIRCGLEQAARERGLNTACVLTSEIKPYAVKVLKENHPGETIVGDIKKVKSENIPDFDVLCAGFPCQAFSYAGKRLGFADTRGTLFFEVERILREKRPKGFILENVEGLVSHDNGRTLDTILGRLENLNYHFDFRVLNSKYFGVPQERKRIYIVGSLNETPNLDNFPTQESRLGDILEEGKPTENTPFIRNLLNHFPLEQLYGKSIKDKRGGDANIHSWDLGIKGPVSAREKALLDRLLTERRKKKWAPIIGIKWMDGMPLTAEQIRTFFDAPDLQDMLDDLTNKGYLKYEHPKKIHKEKGPNDTVVTSRVYDETLPKGYNIVAGKLSFEINKVMSPDEIAPTLVAMDMQKLYVGDHGGLRRITLREGLRLFGYPDNMRFNVSEKEGFDLLGNTVVVPVIKAVAGRLLDTIIN